MDNKTRFGCSTYSLTDTLKLYTAYYLISLQVMNLTNIVSDLVYGNSAGTTALRAIDFIPGSQAAEMVYMGAKVLYYGTRTVAYDAPMAAGKGFIRGGAAAAEYAREMDFSRAAISRAVGQGGTEIMTGMRDGMLALRALPATMEALYGGANLGEMFALAVGVVPGFGQLFLGASLVALTAFQFIVSDFLVPDLIIKRLSGLAGCTTAKYKDGNSDKCVNGFREDGECKPCNQIENMRDYEYPHQYKESYKMFKDITVDNRDKSYVVDISDDPTMTHKLTSIKCNSGSEPVYAERPFPVAACFLKNPSNDDDFDGANKDKGLFLFSDPYICNSNAPWANLSDNSDLDSGSWTNDSKLLWQLNPLPWASVDDKDLITPCSQAAGDKSWKKSLNCWWEKDGDISKGINVAEGELNQFWEETAAKDQTQKPYPPSILDISSFTVEGHGQTQNRPPIDIYDGSNVCKDNYQLAGDNVYNQGGNREYSINDIKNKNDDEVYVSNHCCPKIIGSGDCPRFSSSPVSYNTPKEEFGGMLDFKNDTNTSNCYLLSNSDHPEFIPHDRSDLLTPLHNDYNSNSDFNVIRTGGIHCGPKNKVIATQFKMNKENNEYNTRGDSGLADYDTYLEEDLVKVIKGNNKYYGTRFALDNRYTYEWNNDSGATGYENYLDPFDYIPLDKKKGSKYLEKGAHFDDMIFYTKHANTTINDVIAKGNSHPDRTELLCDNIECDDLEKTKYMQTVYDNFCKIKNIKPGPILEYEYRKFYRPAWIKDKPENLEDEDKDYYSDICCEPIAHSRKTSFVGCDANGENSYFIDKIIQKYNARDYENITIPEKKRTRKNPLSQKLNLNQCIPSMEAKCGRGNDYILNLINSGNPSSPATSINFNNQGQRCNNVFDRFNLNQVSVGTDDTLGNKSLDDICSEDPNCGPFQPQKTFTEKYGIDENEYWKYDRLSVGYAPYKGVSNSWTEFTGSHDNADDKFSSNNFTLNPPSQKANYTECNPIWPYSNIYDLEIYDKRIDSLPSPHPEPNGYPLIPNPNPPNTNYHTIRYIKSGESDDEANITKIHENTEELFKIHCRNYEDLNGDYLYSEPFISSPIEINDQEVLFNIGCRKSDAKDKDGKKYVKIY